MKLEKMKIYLRILKSNRVILGIVLLSLLVSYGFFFSL